MKGTRWITKLATSEFRASYGDIFKIIFNQTTKVARESSPIFNPQQRNWNRVRSPICSGGMSTKPKSKTKSNIWTDHLMMLLLTRKSIMSWKNLSTDCVSAAKVQWNVKQLLNSNTGIFCSNYVKRNNFLLEKIELTLLF